ncbi:MAG: M50 family metallopeptidase [bacterium]|nr:M50 family metallopeptidase [bacterium]
MAAILLIVGISVLILLHEAGHFFAAKHYGIKVEEFGFGFPPRLFSKKKGETTYSFNLLPFGGFVRLYGEHEAHLEGKENIDKKRSFTHQSAWKRFIVIAAGIAINFLLGWIIISSVFMIGAKESIVVTQVLENSPAEQAGIMAGDEFVNFSSSQEFIAHVNQSQGEQLSLKVLRDGEELDFNLSPRTNPEVIAREGAIGAALTETGFPHLGFFESLWEGLVVSINIMAQIIKSLWFLLVGIFTTGAIAEGVVGPVGIFGVANDLGSLGFIYVLQLVGLISLNLAILNALPIPALDGGRIFFILLEKLKGSKLNANKELIANGIGFVLLLLLMIAITIRDVVQLF